MFFVRRRWALRVVEKMGLSSTDVIATELVDMIIQGSKQLKSLFQQSTVPISKEEQVLMSAATLQDNFSAINRLSNYTQITNEESVIILNKVKEAASELANEYHFIALLESPWFKTSQASVDKKDTILFVDIDGVLNTRNHLLLQKRQGNRPTAKKWCPKAITNLNLLVDRLNAKIVVSSTWRYDHTLEELKVLFKENGLNHNAIIGTTPSLIHEHGSVTRGYEIQSWIDQNGSPSSLYLILDDNDDGISERFPHFLKCEQDVGFGSKEKMKEALEIISKQSGL